MAGQRRSSILAVAFAAVVGVGCNAGSTRAEEAAPAQTTVSSSALSRPGHLDGPTTVTDVVDGDTIKVSSGATLRLIGIDTPETVDPRKPVQCFGREASARAHALLDGTRVRLEYDPTQGRVDRYGRTLAYVWMSDGRLYNETIIAEGYAHEYTYAIPYRYRDALRAAERSARIAERGLWSPTTCAGDPTEPTSPTSSHTAASGCDPSYPDGCIPPSPPDLDCADVPFRRFTVAGADPHNFDGNRDGIGCA